MAVWNLKAKWKKIAWELETINGYAVIQCVYNVDNKKISSVELNKLNLSHFKKIDISDAVYIVNIGRYIGSQVKKEIEYAESKGKEAIFYEANSLWQWLWQLKFKLCCYKILYISTIIFGIKLT